MCNVIQLQFSCKHYFRRRRSKCNGTKHKVTRTSIKAACTAEAVLTIASQADCSTCQHQTWRNDWESKLERARRFLNKLEKNRLPGINEVVLLVERLEDEYKEASWSTRNIFAQVPNRKSVPRVNTSDHKRTSSPLLRELYPEDIFEIPQIKQWYDTTEDDYDGNYVASTDPIYPISTDYSLLWGDGDNSWALEHIDGEEVEIQYAEVLVDFDRSQWDWEDDSVTLTPTAAIESRDEKLDVDAQDLHPTESNDTQTMIMAWGPESGAPTSPAEINMLNLSINDMSHTERIAAVVQTFWSAVNNEPQETPETSTFSTTTISSPSTSTQSSSTSWTDGPSDTPPPSPPTTTEPSTQPSTPPSPNSTRAYYNKLCRALKCTKEDDLNRFYSQWLLISRDEAREFEGPEGRCVPSPQTLRDGRINNAG